MGWKERDEGLGEQQRGAEVDGDYAVKYFRSHVGEGQIVFDAGVIDQDMNVRGVAGDFRGEIGDRVRVFKVGDDAIHAGRMGKAHCIGGGSERGAVAVDQQQVRAAGVKLFRDGAANALGRAGNNGNLTVKLPVLLRLFCGFQIRLVQWAASFIDCLRLAKGTRVQNSTG
jgi:hypothetical protein